MDPFDLATLDAPAGSDASQDPVTGPRPAAQRQTFDLASLDRHGDKPFDLAALDHAAPVAAAVAEEDLSQLPIDRALRDVRETLRGAPPTGFLPPAALAPPDALARPLARPDPLPTIGPSWSSTAASRNVPPTPGQERTFRRSLSTTPHVGDAAYGGGQIFRDLLTGEGAFGPGTGSGTVADFTPLYFPRAGAESGRQYERGDRPGAALTAGLAAVAALAGLVPGIGAGERAALQDAAGAAEIPVTAGMRIVPRAAVPGVRQPSASTTVELIDRPQAIAREAAMTRARGNVDVPAAGSTSEPPHIPEGVAPPPAAPVQASGTAPAAVEERRATPSANAPAPTPSRPTVKALAPSGEIEYRNLGISPSPTALADAKSTLSEAVSDPNAKIVDEHPQLAKAISSANAMTPRQAGTFAQQMANRVVEGLSDEQRAQFGTRLTLDQLDAEIARKGAGADALERQAAAEVPAGGPAKSSRGFWYTAATDNGTLRDVNEMETGPLLDELTRRTKASKRYYANETKYGAGSAVTIRNERKMAEIEDILTDRDKLDQDAIWNEVKRRQASGGVDFDFGANVGTGQPALKFARHEPPPVVSEAAQQATDLRGTTQRLKAAADALRPTVPAHVANAPWFREALARHQTMVAPFIERASLGAGVEQGAFRQPSLGAYVRLVPQERITEPLIDRAQATAATAGSEATTPRTGVMRKLIGQKSTVTAAAPRGAEAPIQGPSDIRRDTPAGGAGGGGASSTLESGSAKRVTGGRNYSTDYVTNVAYDAADKVAKAAHNSVFDALTKDAAAGRGGIYELAADQHAPPGLKVVAFNDRKQLVDVPAPGAETAAPVRRFAVPRTVARAIERYKTPSAPTTAMGSALSKGASAVTRSVLMNPVVAGTHTLTLASSVGTGIPASGATRAVATTLPGAKMIGTLARMRGVDFADAATTARLHRLAFSGALRIGEDEGGLMNAGHKFLFGPKGMDVRARIVASEDAQAGLAKAGIAPTDPRFDGLERKYVVEHAGNYVGKNQGTVVRWLSENGIAPFIAINRAKLGTSLKALVGSDGLIAPTAARRLGVVARGPLGAAASIAGASYLLSGHSPADNAPGHEGDMALGVYHTRDDRYVYYRGDPKKAVDQFGPGTKEVYLRRGILDPTSEAALRVLQPLVTAHAGDRLHDVLRAAVNTGLGFIGPAPGAVFGLATGKSLYLDPEGNFAGLDDPTLPGARDAGLKQRLIAATRNANAGAALVLPPQGDQPAVSLGKPLVNVLAEGSPTARAGKERHDYATWEQEKVSEIYAAKTPDAREKVVDAALKEAAAAGFTGPMVRATLQKTANRATAGAGSGRSATRFENRIRGTAPPDGHTARPP